MENLLKDIPGVLVYLDDILISGKSETEHMATLEVLQRLAAVGLHLKREKCTFLVSSITYLGYRIDSQGLHPVSDSVCHTECPKAAQSVITEVLLRLVVLLFTFPPQFAKYFSPILSFVMQLCTVEMGKARK